MASSRVGVRIRARMTRGLGTFLDRRCKMGAEKAQVLPVPVWAQPSTSLPARAGGMAPCWMGVGAVYSCSARAFKMGSQRPSCLKFM